ncbi:hypothetical protein GF312_06195 [Candidatus Poribacteria bacterium]|nr:hypothetical protein [Candidatus Poribacteria bacterium]
MEFCEIKLKEGNSPKPHILATLLLSVSAFAVVSLWLFIAFFQDAVELWLYFAYITIACTLLPLPTPQVIMLYGQRFDPYFIALLGTVGFCISGLFDYILVNLALRYHRVSKLKNTKTYAYLERIFHKVPFVSLSIAAFTPLPFDPVKFLACTTCYSKIKFTIAMFIGRFPRCLLLGVLQRELLIKRLYLYLSIPVVVAIVLTYLFVKHLRQEKHNMEQYP